MKSFFAFALAGLAAAVELDDVCTAPGQAPREPDHPDGFEHGPNAYFVYGQVYGSSENTKNDTRFVEVDFGMDYTPDSQYNSPLKFIHYKNVDNVLRYGDWTNKNGIRLSADWLNQETA